jgi:hypothetical protein
MFSDADLSIAKINLGTILPPDQNRSYLNQTLDNLNQVMPLSLPDSRNRLLKVASKDPTVPDKMTMLIYAPLNNPELARTKGLETSHEKIADARAGLLFLDYVQGNIPIEDPQLQFLRDAKQTYIDQYSAMCQSFGINPDFQISSNPPTTLIESYASHVCPIPNSVAGIFIGTDRSAMAREVDFHSNPPTIHEGPFFRFKTTLNDQGEIIVPHDRDNTKTHEDFHSIDFVVNQIGPSPDVMRGMVGEGIAPICELAYSISHGLARVEAITPESLQFISRAECPLESSSITASPTTHEFWKQAFAAGFIGERSNSLTISADLMNLVSQNPNLSFPDLVGIYLTSPSYTDFTDRISQVAPNGFAEFSQSLTTHVLQSRDLRN